LTPTDLGFEEPAGLIARIVSGDGGEKGAVEEVLRRHGGSVSRAAVELGLSRQAFYRKMERLGITLERRPRE
jgi:transcriptional regulator of acetoin/glycerol metabolism